MYLSWLWSVVFFSTSLILCHSHLFLTRLLTFGILFSAAVNAEVVAEPLIFSISILTSFNFVLRIVLVAKLEILGILSSIFLILELYSVFLTTSFLATLYFYLNQQEQVRIYQYLICLLYFLNCLNYSATFLIY